MKKAILYTSVNYWDKDATEQLKKQQQELQEYCEKNNIKIICLYNERSDVKLRMVLHMALDHIKSGSMKPDLLLYQSAEIFLPDLAQAIVLHQNFKNLGVFPRAVKDSNIIIS